MELTGLNPSQKTAVTTTEGRLLVLAGAGSGKTRVLTTRIAYLIERQNVAPSAILGLTFTNKAAKEMRSRLATLIPPKKAEQVTLSTFHSFCLGVLRAEIEALGFTKNFSLWDSHDVERAIRAIVRDLLGREGEIPSLGPTMEIIHRARAKTHLAEELGEPFWHGEFAKTVYARLQSAFRAFNALDFDALLTETVRLFEFRPDILAKYHDTYRYVMIDEYQDTNPIQYKLAEQLVQKSSNLCAVGDDDQSIYGWRGASLDNILQFEMGGKAQVIKLEENFRSTEVILSSSNAVIKKNVKRMDKSLWSQKGRGEPIEIFHAPSPESEAEAVIGRLLLLKEKTGCKWSDFAILYRSNALSQVMELQLEKRSAALGRGIPYRIFGGSSFFERKEIKDLAAYLRFILNPVDEVSLLRIINYPRRGIGETTLDLLTKANREQSKPLWEICQECASSMQESGIPEKGRMAVRQFVSFIEEAKKVSIQLEPARYLEWLISSIGIEKAIDEEVASDKMRQWKKEGIAELIRFFERETGDLKSILAALHLDSGTPFYKNEEQTDAVSLMTIHTSKGLEFPILFLIGVEDHILPHERSVEEGSLEEERRLLYVAMTRAKERLIISMARARKRVGGEMSSLPSRFLHDIPKEFLAPTAWDDPHYP